MGEGKAINPRLLDAVAMCLCWAEFPGMAAHRPPDETPASYWAKMPQLRREAYYADAELIGRFMAGDRELRLVPVSALPIRGPARKRIDALPRYPKADGDYA